jgi:1-acyl-sn-glycerol-3-phosphate acyltransferase
MEKNNEHFLPYPRLTVRRKILGAIGRFLMRVLARPQIEGLENIPEEGPVILAGNHVSSLEPVFMFLFTERQVEPIGAGDMPFDGALDLIVNYYGIIPVNRGQLDRKAMSKAVSVLEQKGFLGIYPEGGIWFPGQMRTHIGVSLLSHRGQAKVVPIGFSGFRDSWNQAFSFKRPVLKMKVGEAIPALSTENDDRPIKDIYQEYADNVMEKVNELIDPDEFLAIPSEREFALDIVRENDNVLNLPGHDAIAQFFHSPVVLHSLLKNLKKPIKLLYPEKQVRTIPGFAKALRASLDILQENAGFFTYRYGMERGRELEAAIRCLIDFLENQAGNAGIRLLARARYRYPDGRVEELSHTYELSAA